MAKTAFISYASEDESVAGTISEYLEQSGVSCWIASRDVRPGADYGSEIIDGIETSTALVLVLSEHANSSEFVKREVERAVSKGKPIFPVRVREVVPSKSLELFISSAEWIDAWQPPIEQYLGRLAESIRSAATLYTSGAAGRPAEPLSRPAVPRRDVQRPVMIGLGLAVVLLSVLLAWSMMSGPAAPTAATASPASASPSSSAAAPSGVPAGPDLAVPGIRETDPCPKYLGINRALPTPFTCSCSAQATTESSVWGTDVYTDDSGLCRAALHAGVITPAGGSVTVIRGGGRPLYVGSERNGVSSNDFSAFPVSIEFKGAAPPPPGPGLCPKYLGINRELPTPFTCRCTGQATQSGTAWGTDVYTDDSAMCRAAFHAGKIPITGGTITAIRVEGRALYVGSTRNGVQSNDFGAFPSSIAFR
jgi:TIR domain/LCCL domain